MLSCLLLICEMAQVQEQYAYANILAMYFWKASESKMTLYDPQR